MNYSMRCQTRELYPYNIHTKDKTMTKQTTLDYYNAHAQEFVQGTVAVDFSITQDRFWHSWKREPASWILAATVASLSVKEPKVS